MKIKRIKIYQVDLPLEGPFNISISRERKLEMLDSTIVAIETDQGITGWGETCPIGATYLPAFALGARAGISELAPHLINEDPRQISRINLIMDKALLGHPYVKSALDMACWDILGKTLGLPLCDLLGGRMNEDLTLMESIFINKPEKMIADIDENRAKGIRSCQIKVGDRPQNDIDRIRAVYATIKPGEVMYMDANRGWLLHEAIRVVRAVKDLDVYFEEPCSTYEDSLKVRRMTDHPFIIDESMDCLSAMLRGYHDAAMDVVAIKLSKVGGLSKARLIKDVCIELGIPMRVEDTWGSDFTVAATAHLAHAIPQNLLFATHAEMTTLRTAEGAPKCSNGYLRASTAPGLGVTPIIDVLVDPVSVFE